MRILHYTEEEVRLGTMPGDVPEADLAVCARRRLRLCGCQRTSDDAEERTEEVERRIEAFEKSAFVRIYSDKLPAAS